jgi:riboflavin biosynthesis pyrimidine reductase
VATGEQADASAVRTVGRSMEGVFIAGTGRNVDGRRLITQLVSAGFRRIYSIAGPGVLETLLRAGALHRIYFTQVHRLIGGTSYDTLLEGNLLHPPADFSLQTLYYDPQPGKACAQFFGTYEITRAEKKARYAGLFR